MRLLGKTNEEWPNFVDNGGACFEHCLEHTLEAELGDQVYVTMIRTVADEFGYNKLDHAKKNPSVVAEVMRRANKQGATSKTLASIIQYVYEMRRPTISMAVAEPSIGTH